MRITIDGPSRRALLAGGAAAAALQAAAPARANSIEVAEMRYLASPNRVTFPELAEDLGYLEGLKLKSVGDATGGPQSLQAVATGDSDFAASFNGSLLNLRAAKVPLKAVVSYYGTDKLTWRGIYVRDDAAIRSPRDLVGRKIALNTLGAYFEFIIKEYLARNGIGPEDIKKVTLVPMPFVSAEQTLRQGVIDAAVLEDIFREKAVARGGLRLLFSDYDLFGPFQAATIILHEKFLRANPNAARLFVGGTARAIEWTRTRPREEVIARFKEIIRKRARRSETTEVVEYWQSPGVGIKGGVIQEREFTIFYDWLVANGQLKAGLTDPKDAYTNEFNPYG